MVAEAADSYFQARGDQARLAIAQSQVETDARLLELVRLRFSRGASAEKEVAQAEALLAQARATIPPLRTALEASAPRDQRCGMRSDLLLMKPVRCAMPGATRASSA